MPTLVSVHIFKWDALRPLCTYNPGVSYKFGDSCSLLFPFFLPFSISKDFPGSELVPPNVLCLRLKARKTSIQCTNFLPPRTNSISDSAHIHPTEFLGVAGFYCAYFRAAYCRGLSMIEIYSFITGNRNPQVLILAVQSPFFHGNINNPVFRPSGGLALVLVTILSPVLLQPETFPRWQANF